MKVPKKPKLKSLPKRPKASAPVSSWENYEKKVKEVQKENKAKLAAWEKAKSDRASGLKKKASIMKKTQGVGRL